MTRRLTTIRLHGIQVQVKDSLTKESKSFTVHNMHYKDVFNKLFSYFAQLEDHGNNLRLVCYKKEGVNENGNEKIN